MRLTHGGNLGIGTTDPSAKLEVSGGDIKVTSGDIRIENGENSKIWHSAHNLTIENQNNNHHIVNIQPGTHSAFVYSQLRLKKRENGSTLETTIQLDSRGTSYFNGGKVGIGTTDPVVMLDVNGTTRTKVIQITGGSDLAEPFAITGAEAIKPGMVVSIDPEQPGQLRVSSQAYDRTVAGIIGVLGGFSVLA